MKDPLADVLLPEDTADTIALRVGTVSATSPTEISLGGQDGLNAACLGWYSPAVGDVVAILQNKTTLLVLGNMTSIAVIGLAAMIGEMILGKATPGG